MLLSSAIFHSSINRIPILLANRYFSTHIQIPDGAIKIEFVRSPGPGKSLLAWYLDVGGQNVNKVNTKAEARFNVYSADWLPE